MDSVTEYERPPRPARRGLTFFEVFLAAVILMALGSVLLPAYGDSRHPKFTTSLSNIKQLGLSILMYGGDHNDMFVIVGQWNSQDPDAHREYGKSWYMPWTGLVEVYMKNQDILRSPLVGRVEPFAGPGKNGCNTVRSCALLYPSYGYNGVYLSPSILQPDGSAHISALSTTEVAKPQEQVMLTEIWSPNKTHFGATSSGANDAYISFATAEAPDGATDLTPGRPYGRLSWGGYSKRIDAMLQTRSEGQRTAGVAFRCAERTPVVFTDGHAKGLFADTLAVGTDWNAGSFKKARNLKNGTYMWDPRGL